MQAKISKNVSEKYPDVFISRRWKLALMGFNFNLKIILLFSIFIVNVKALKNVAIKNWSDR